MPYTIYAYSMSFWGYKSIQDIFPRRNPGGEGGEAGQMRTVRLWRASGSKIGRGGGGGGGGGGEGLLKAPRCHQASRFGAAVFASRKGHRSVPRTWCALGHVPQLASKNIIPSMDIPSKPKEPRSTRLRNPQEIELVPC